jgi:hypothetical protein
MSKEQPRAKQKSVRTERSLIPERFQHYASIGVLILSLLIFFWPVLYGGKTFLSSDSIASHAWDTLLKDAETQGIYALWNPYIFCGMPGFASLTFTGNRWYDLSARVYSFAKDGVYFLLGNTGDAAVLVYYIAFITGMYILLFSKTRSKLAAVIGSLGSTYSMYIIIWIMSGHATKIATIQTFPWILLVLERLREKFDWRLAVALTVLVHFALLATHVQMIFYIFLAIGIYLSFLLIRSLVKKEDFKGILRAGLVLAAASVIGFAMDSDRYLSVLEYNPYSIRGSAPIHTDTQQPDSKTQSSGLDYDYATQWSFSPGEMMTWLVPNWYGFGGRDYTGILTQNRTTHLNFYFGPMTFTDGPQFMGVIVLVLAMIGFFRFRSDPFVQFLGTMSLVALLISFGKEFPLLFDPMFKYFPGFNKFRIPSMVLVLVQMFVPMLAAYGVSGFLEDRGKNLGAKSDQRWKYTLIGLASALVITLLIKEIVVTLFGTFQPFRDVAPLLVRSVRTNQPEVLNEVYRFVTESVVDDVRVGLFLLLAAFGALHLYRKGAISMTLLSIVLSGAVVADLWRVALEPNKPQLAAEQQQIFTPPDYVRALQQDTSTFRVLQFTNNQLQYDNTLAYFRIQSGYGYQGAKLRAYQDMIDIAGTTNPLVWQLMNVKYVLSNTPDSSGLLIQSYKGAQYSVYQYRYAVPRAFFVDAYQVANGVETLEKIKSMSSNAFQLAFAERDLGEKIDAPDSTARAELVQYGIQNLELRVKASGNNLLFLSETYYPLGWKALLDGREIPIHRLNYLFRGVIVSKGEHRLEMRFEPRGFALGKNISLAANVLVLGAAGVAGVDWWRRRKTTGGSR